MTGWSQTLGGKSITAEWIFFASHHNANFTVMDQLSVDAVPIIYVREEVDKLLTSDDGILFLKALRSPKAINEITPVGSNGLAIDAPSRAVSVVINRFRAVGAIRDNDCPIRIDDQGETVPVISHATIPALPKHMIAPDFETKIRSLRRGQCAFCNVSLLTDTVELEQRDNDIDSSYVNNCPARRWWPFGILIAAVGLTLADYGAKRFYKRGLERRIYQLWWLPLVYLLIILGCRVAAYGFCRAVLPFE